MFIKILLSVLVASVIALVIWLFCGGDDKPSAAADSEGMASYDDDVIRNAVRDVMTECERPDSEWFDKVYGPVLENRLQAFQGSLLNDFDKKLEGVMKFRVSPEEITAELLSQMKERGIILDREKYREMYDEEVKTATERRQRKEMAGIVSAASGCVNAEDCKRIGDSGDMDLAGKLSFVCDAVVKYHEGRVRPEFVLMLADFLQVRLKPDVYINDDTAESVRKAVDRLDVKVADWDDLVENFNNRVREVKVNPSVGFYGDTEFDPGV